ncbi:hypothetical protein CC31p116 [Enterobacter phage CC31]|uniref:Uncharacterized protein n=1 Tax=Enterobacter phage CC31 TaxID=709484 RepID=E5DIC7_9CAUD|nr:hypothetical protein CC31p116 [Enterobacter phage CC31]ADB81612.1 hypothetical protein CC31p116 [Enterobacter phage CC31]
MNKNVKIFNTVLLAITLVAFVFLGIKGHAISKQIEANKLLADKVCQLVVEGDYVSEAYYSGNFECYKKVL